jgi:hypothetical protein
MSHITCQSERDENAEILACPFRDVYGSELVEHKFTGEIYEEERRTNECGKSERIATGKERCLRCGKTFTY